MTVWLTCPVRRLLSTALQHSKGMDLQALVWALKTFAPPSLAEEWDNVGLLVEPSPNHTVSKLLLTNDLTEAVMEEAIGLKVNAIFSYHPPIFRPLKRLTQETWKERLIVKCIENRIAVYSPHTSLDAIDGGVNDWLLQPFTLSNKSVIQGTPQTTSPTTIITAEVRPEKHAGLKDALHSSLRDIVSPQPICSDNTVEKKTVFSIHIQRDDVHIALKILNQWNATVVNFNAGSEYKSLSTGSGRMGVLSSPMTLKAIVALYKSHLDVPHLMLSLGVGKTIDSQVGCLAVCAGSGASVLLDRRAQSAELLVTGEMSHHEVLEAASRGVSVILAGHSNSERGFLTEARRALEIRLGPDVLVDLARSDADPLNVV